ncbi:hypothetical protein VTK56DRAFT_3248 [Thermocarpiscus australiensis]
MSDEKLGFSWSLGPLDRAFFWSFGNMFCLPMRMISAEQRSALFCRPQSGSFLTWCPCPWLTVRNGRRLMKMILGSDKIGSWYLLILSNLPPTYLGQGDSSRVYSLNREVALTPGHQQGTGARLERRLGAARHPQRGRCRHGQQGGGATKVACCSIPSCNLPKAEVSSSFLELKYST